MIEQMPVHEAAVALGMILRQADIFIQVIRRSFGKADDAFAVHFNEPCIYTDRRASGSQAEHGFGIALQQADDQVRTCFCEIFFIIEF
ncbi:hypothetical protein D3C74_466800 [compost metagenome]